MLMEEMKPQPKPGDLCHVRYTGYRDNGGEAPPKEGDGIYIKTFFWGGGRYQRVFRFPWGEERIYDDHDVFECKILQEGAEKVEEEKPPAPPKGTRHPLNILNDLKLLVQVRGDEQLRKLLDEMHTSLNIHLRKWHT